MKRLVSSLSTHVQRILKDGESKKKFAGAQIDIPPCYISPETQSNEPVFSKAVDLNID